MRIDVGWEDLTSVCVVEVVQKGQCQYLYEASVRREGVEEEKENYPDLCVEIGEQDISLKVYCLV